MKEMMVISWGLAVVVVVLYLVVDPEVIRDVWMTLTEFLR